jgi:hypothetical protein
MVNQSEGPATVAFAIQGSGFAAGSSVTFSLNELGPSQQNLVSVTSRYHEIVGPHGTFRVAFSRLYSDSLQLGQFTVTASAPGSKSASTQFIVIPPAGAQPGPPGG